MSFGTIVRGVLLAMALAVTLPVSAQEGVGTGARGLLSAGEGPLEVEADEGLELRQKERLLIARGNAIARQGDVTLAADVLAASYAETEGGEQRIERIDAIGSVVIRTPTETVRGDRAVYDLIRDVAQVTGENLRLETPEQVVTARDSLEFWNAEQRAVARGDAIVAQGAQRMRADVLEALLAEAGENGDASVTATADGERDLPAIRMVRAWGNVLISTDDEIVRGERGEYDVVTGLATLDGSVRITRGDNQLDGDRAVVNMNTGVSRLVSADGGSRGRVRGLFFPGSEEPPPRPGDRD